MVKWIVVSAGLVVMVLVAACGDDDADTTTQPPATTQAATTTTPAATVGDPERGRQIWDDGGGGPSGGCSGCHSLDGSEKVAGDEASSEKRGEIANPFLGWSNVSHSTARKQASASYGSRFEATVSW